MIRELILFAAKLGFISRKNWEEFFGTDDRSWRFRKWKSLLEKRILLPHPSLLAKGFYVLNPRNRLVKEITKNEISAPPYLAHLEHDEYLARFLLKLKSGKIIGDFKCESELKRIQSYGLKVKFPDVVFQTYDVSPEKIAVELELTVKSIERYRKIFETYQDSQQVQYIIYVINSSAVFNSISKALRVSKFPHHEIAVGFSRLEDWLQDPTNAPIKFHDRTTSMRDLIKKR